MLILGNEVGELYALDLYNRYKKIGILIEDLPSLSTSPINKIKCNREDKIFCGSSNGTIGIINKKTKKMIKIRLYSCSLNSN